MRLVDLPNNYQVVGLKWVYKVKKYFEGNLYYKARLEAKGYEKYQVVSFEAVFARVAKMKYVRLLITLVPQDRGGCIT